MKYRKKPVEIEAIQWNGENVQEIVDFVGNTCTVDMLQYSNTNRPIYTFSHSHIGRQYDSKCW